jgi:uroporphyrinogen III methyltransferase/synthase
MSPPLSGKRVLVTRAEGQAEKLVAMLRERGAEPLVVPLIAFEPPTDPEPLRRALASLADYGWVLFTSENGVRFFWESLTHQGLDAAVLGNARLGAVGPGTAQALEARGLRVDVVAKEFRGEGLARVLLDAMGADRPRVLLARAEEAREVLPDTLRAAGCVVDVVPVYVTRAVKGAGERLRELLGEGVDAVMFTSASTVGSFCDALGPSAKDLLATVKVASIGPITTEAAQKRGLDVAITAGSHTLPALVDALEASYRA